MLSRGASIPISSEMTLRTNDNSMQCVINPEQRMGGCTPHAFM